MTKFNTRSTRAATATGPLTASTAQPMRTHEGGPGFGRDDKSDLILLATTSIDITADTFYEKGDARVKRMVDLVGRTAVADPDWTYRFVTWLRTKGNLRTAAMILGVEAAYAMTAAGIPGGRAMVATALRRADEPGEALAYASHAHGRNLPMPIKRGVADAARRLYNEYAVLKYDTASHGYRFADVLALTHPTPDRGKPWQGDLFRYAIDRRYGHDRGNDYPHLTVIENNARVRLGWAADTLGRNDLTPHALQASGMTWEDVLSALGAKMPKADLWRALIPGMGFMARLKNLRNFDEAGLSDADVKPVIDMLMDPEQVRGSKQLPLRFLSAYRAAPSLRWSHPLDNALNASVQNIPALPGRTLILVDTSSSMADRMGDRSELFRWDAAVNFALALALRCHHADVVSYSGDPWGNDTAVDRYTKVFPQKRGESLLTSIERWKRGGYFLRGGTNTAGALRGHYNGHDRVIILTDEQAGTSERYYGGHKVTDQMPKDRPMTTINLAGYQASHAATDRNRLLLGGLTDAMFPLIAQVETGRPGAWPWTGDADIPGLPSYGPQPVARTAVPR